MVGMVEQKQTIYTVSSISATNNHTHMRNCMVHAQSIRQKGHVPSLIAKT